MTQTSDRRLIIVSNRVAMPKKKGAAAGGLAVGILAALKDQGGMWFGWSGKLTEKSDAQVEVARSRVATALDKRAWELVDRYMWGAGGAAAISPLPLLDLAAGGAVTVVFNGQQELMKISIDPKLVEPEADGSVDLEMLEDTIVAAVSEGLRESKDLMKTEMDKATGGLSSTLPGLF